MNIILACTAAILLFLALLATAPSQEQIERCAETSGWSVERCKFEMTR